jgi:hypothetical protein
VDFLKGNHLSKEIATMPWLWESRNPATPRWVTVRTKYVWHVHIGDLWRHACGSRPLDRPGRIAQVVGRL